MKVLLVAPMHNGGDAARGLSYEHYNFFMTLSAMPQIECAVFDYLTLMREHGREAMNRMLPDAAKREKPDVIVVILSTDELQHEAIDEIRQTAPTVGYFYDDMWRIEYARFWAAHFSFITTSDVNGVRKFAAAGFHNVIPSSFACNHQLYSKRDLPKAYDVTFVGQYHPIRDWHLRQVARAGINVRMWGPGWQTGHLSHDDMVKVFCQSKINLNLSNTVSWDVRYLLSSYRAARNTMSSAVKRDRKTREQVKGRHFEINACGGFQLSYYVEGLERCYRIGEEIAIYGSPEDLVEKIRYYLANNEERELIARQGHERTLAEHTMEKRLAGIFDAVGLKA